MEVYNVHPFKIREIPRYKVSDNYVGLLLITYNDAENLKQMLPSFEKTVDYPTVLLIQDMCSTDETRDIIKDWESKIVNPFIIDVQLEVWGRLESLTKVMNLSFSRLMARQECNYIGWVHPDMLFEEPWLRELVATLQVRPEIGKICSFNTRDGLPTSDALIDGQEQCYIVPRGVLLKVGLFDEKFIGIGGREDWDLNNRIKREGLKVAITPKSRVWHKGMATRERRDTTAEQIHNRDIYFQKWGTYEEFIEFG